MSALIQDLDKRHLLATTLVIWMGDFGRTPKINANDGRDHHPNAFSIWLAGGGVKSGHLHGAPDDFGFNVIANPVHVHERSLNSDEGEQKFKKFAKQLHKSESSSLKIWKPHKFQKNSMLPPTKPLREAKSVYYLEKKRKERETSNFLSKEAQNVESFGKDILAGNTKTQNIKEMQAKAFKLEELARKKENLLDTNPISVSAINKAASVDSLLLSSIKAKLMILGKLENN